jgi:hypothetical protein
MIYMTPAQWQWRSPTVYIGSRQTNITNNKQQNNKQTSGTQKKTGVHHVAAYGTTSSTLTYSTVPLGLGADPGFGIKYNIISVLQ